jgi:hypothetical protein
LGEPIAGFAHGMLAQLPRQKVTRRLVQPGYLSDTH